MASAAAVAARIASYGTTSAQVTLPRPEMGMSPWYSLRDRHANALPLIQPLDGSFPSAGRSTLSLCMSLSRWMPPVRADALQSTGRQPRVSGQGLDCFGTSTASSCWPVLLALRRSGRCCLASTCWSARTTLRPSRTSTGRVVYDHIACHNITRHLLWSQTQHKSLRAVHILGKLNRAAEGLSRQLTFPGEW